jgi:hypothetical protein
MCVVRCTCRWCHVRVLNNTATGRGFAPPSAVTNVMFDIGAIVVVLRCVKCLRYFVVIVL